MVVRRLREADLLTTGARGRHAPQTQPLDASRILTALLIQERTVDAPLAVHDFGTLVCIETKVEEFPAVAPERHLELDLPVGHLFEDGLAALIKKLATAPSPSNQTHSLHFNGVPIPAGLAVWADITNLICGIEIPATTYTYAHHSLANNAAAAATPYLTTMRRHRTSNFQVRHTMPAHMLARVAADFAGGD